MSCNEAPLQLKAEESIDVAGLVPLLFRVSKEHGVHRDPYGSQRASRLELQYITRSYKEKRSIFDQVKQWILEYAPDGELFFLAIKLDGKYLKKKNAFRRWRTSFANGMILHANIVWTVI